MQKLRDLKDEDLKGLAPEATLHLATQMLRRMRQQYREIQFKDAKIEKIALQLAQLKAWKFGAKTEAMSAEQWRLFEETFAEDEASLQAQLEQAKGHAGTPPATDPKSPRKPRRQPLPEHLRREEHHHEPQSTSCPSVDCGRQMVRIGEDVSERLGHRPGRILRTPPHLRQVACRCCQQLVQERAAPQIIEGGMAAAGLIAHTMVDHYVDHLPYYRMESSNARSGVHTPRSTLASWSGSGGGALVPVFEAHKRFVLSAAVLHADETSVAMLDPGAGKTKRAYVWSYARGAFDAAAGVVYDFCVGRGARYPIAFLGAADDYGGQRSWRGTLVRDEYGAYDSVITGQPGRFAAGCLAHARGKFDELLRDASKSAVAVEALQRIAQIYRAERELAAMSAPERLAAKQSITRPLWEQLHAWLKLERGRVPDGSATDRALNYSLNAWEALTRHLLDGDVPVDNNHCENLICPNHDLI